MRLFYLNGIQEGIIHARLKIFRRVLFKQAFPYLGDQESLYRHRRHYRTERRYYEIARIYVSPSLTRDSLNLFVEMANVEREKLILLNRQRLDPTLMYYIGNGAHRRLLIFYV